MANNFFIPIQEKSPDKELRVLSKNIIVGISEYLNKQGLDFLQINVTGEDGRKWSLVFSENKLVGNSQRKEFNKKEQPQLAIKS